jgi:phage protein D
MKDSAIAAQVAREAGLRAQATDTKVTLPHVMQSNETDLELLRRRADLIGFEVFVRDKVLHFQPPQNAGKAVVKLGLDADVTEFSARLQAAAQVGEVSVRGWDVKAKSPILGKAAKGQERSAMGGRSSGPKTADKAFGKAAVATVDQPVQTKAEADQIALGRFNDQALGYVQGEATCEGRPSLRAGTVVEIEGAGKTFSGPYYVTSVTHTMTSDVGYSTSLELRRSAAG